MIFFDKESIFFLGGGFFYKLTRNPNLTKIFFFFFFFFFFFWGGGGGGKSREEKECTCMNKCFKWRFYSSLLLCAKLFRNPCIYVGVMA